MSSIDRPGTVRHQPVRQIRGGQQERIETTRDVMGKPEQCQTMTYVIAELSVTANRELVNQMQITVLDAGLDSRSREATRAFIKQSETATEKQRIEAAKQQPPPKL